MELSVSDGLRMIKSHLVFFPSKTVEDSGQRCGGERQVGLEDVRSSVPLDSEEATPGGIFQHDGTRGHSGITVG